MHSSSEVEVLPSQVSSCSTNLPINKLLENLNKNQRLLQSLPQNYKKRESFTVLYKTLVNDYFYLHERPDVQLSAAICLADIIRIWAPNLPDIPPEKTLNMFLFLARQLSGLKDIDDPLYNRRYYLIENLSMVQSFIPAISLEENNGCQISSVIFTNLFNAVQKNHSVQLKNLMNDLLSVLLAEYESVPFPLLELLFERIIDPEKKLREECYELVESIIRKTEVYLKSAIVNYFKAVLVTEDIENLKLANKIYYIFDEFCHISESIVDDLIPFIEHRLTQMKKHRRDATKIVAYVLSSPNNDFALKHKSLWTTFLQKFRDTTDIQLTCIKPLKNFFFNHQELRADLEPLIYQLSHSPDQEIRTQIIAQVRVILNGNLENINATMRSILIERARDKVWEIRKETLDFLGHCYKKECSSGSWSDKIQKQLSWVANCIINLYYQASLQDKLLAERILSFYLMPWDFSADEKVRVLLNLYSNVDENAQRAIREIFNTKFIFRRHLLRVVELGLQMADPSTSNDQKELTEIKLVNLIHSISTRSLPNPEKNEVLLKAFVVHAIKTHRERSSTTLSMLMLLKKALAENINSKEAYAYANIIGQQLLDESIKEQKRCPTTTPERKDEISTISDLNGNGQFAKMCTLVKTVFEKISTLLFDQESMAKLLEFIYGKIVSEQEQTPLYYENINQLLKIFLQHPFIFDHTDIQTTLSKLLNLRILELVPMILKIIEVCAPSIIAKNPTLHTSFQSQLLELLSLHPPIVKRVIHCLYALYPDTRDKIFQKIIEDTLYDEIDGEQLFASRLVALGHMIYLAPLTVGRSGKRILGKISRYILDENSDKEHNFALLPDEPNTDSEIGPETRVKRELIKAMTRAVCGLQDNSIGLFPIVYRLIRKCIEGNDEDFVGRLNEAEVAYIRLCGLSCLLQLICNPYFYPNIIPDDFFLILTLLRDPLSRIRSKAYRKLIDRLREPTNPVELLALVAFAAKEPEREHRDQIRRSMLTVIDQRREYIKLQLSYKTATINDMESEDDNALLNNNQTLGNRSTIDCKLNPEYSLAYFIYFLSKSPAYILPDDNDLLHTMTDYILFLIDSLLLRCDATVGLFYKGLLRSIKSSEDVKISKNRNDALERKDSTKKLHVLADLTYVILSQRASSIMMCTASSVVPLPENYYKKTKFNHYSCLPKDFKLKLYKPSTMPTIMMAGQTGKTTKKLLSADERSTTPEEDGKRKKKIMSACEEVADETSTTPEEDGKRKKKIMSACEEAEDDQHAMKRKRTTSSADSSYSGDESNSPIMKSKCQIKIFKSRRQNHINDKVNSGSDDENTIYSFNNGNRKKGETSSPLRLPTTRKRQTIVVPSPPQLPSPQAKHLSGRMNTLQTMRAKTTEEEEEEQVTPSPPRRNSEMKKNGSSDITKKSIIKTREIYSDEDEITTSTTNGDTVSDRITESQITVTGRQSSLTSTRIDLSASSEHIKSNSLINNNNNTTKNNEEEKKKDRFLTIPNALTVGRILCTPLIGYFIVTEYYTSALILFLSAGMTDLLDGYIARRFPSQQSAIGSFLDPFADKILVGVVVIAAWYKALIPLWLLALILVRDIAIMLVAGYIRFISVDKPRTLKKVLNMKEATVQLYPTFVSKVNTGVQIGLFTLCLASPVFNYQHSDWMTVIYLLSAASTGVSWLSYVAQGKQTFKLLGKKNPPST
ncbi:unnamed protein product [Didymodactylos carnosus]|uniref:Uncharacterized protein n=1 Tax=Didymodactylos carnosus TaxID=1234261 RepID=A0A8S2HWF2_9BILA|nr:unnamed protein product [Didymodactylos carnosus]CAF3674304.1 unnamed protein product [Didymodactylos carnosus]